jgi:hypothetical protein
MVNDKDPRSLTDAGLSRDDDRRCTMAQILHRVLEVLVAMVIDPDIVFSHPES